MQLLTTEILSNVWCAQFWSTYSTVITLVPSSILGVLQLIAIFHPDITSNGVFSLIKRWLTKSKNVDINKINTNNGNHEEDIVKEK